MGTGVELIFKIAAIAVITAVLYQLLKSSQREELAILTSISGAVVILFMLLYEISDMFTAIRNLFGI